MTSPTTLVVLPILIPLLTAGLCLSLRQHARLQAMVGVSGAGLLLLAAIGLIVLVDCGCVQTVQMGDWVAPVGITLVADRLGAIMVGLAGVMGLVVSIFALSDIDPTRHRAGFYPFLHVLLMGCCGAFLTGDLFNLYVWFEVLLLASFGLLSVGGGRREMEGAFKYVVLNLIGSMLFLAGVGVLYGTVHTLNFADLNGRMGELYASRPELVTALAALFVLAFSLKAAIFPLFSWLPASYHVPPATICAIFAALLTKVGVYSLLRGFTLVFDDVSPMLLLILIATSITMLSGVFGAITQYNMKRILAWHSISQVGYIVIGVALLISPDVHVKKLGIAASVVFLVHHGLVKPALFLSGGLIERARGTSELKPIGGLAIAAPWLAGLFLLAALSLAGIPPLSGFWAKLAVIQAGLIGEFYWVVAASLAAGLLTLLSMIKIWNEAFWKDTPREGKGHDHTHDDDHHGHGDPADEPAIARLPLAMTAPTIALVGLITLIGIFPQPLLGYAERTAEQVLDTASYVRAVAPADSALDGPPDATKKPNP